MRKASFTGAAAKHLGKFEQADGGTLFLDEIGDMPLAMQAKLLRVLEEGEVERVGGDKPMQVNVRVLWPRIAIWKPCEAKCISPRSVSPDLRFSADLPPLRERPEDFPGLVKHFARQVATQNGWKEKPFAKDAIDELRRYGWPGNIRELRNVVERLVLLAGDEPVGAADVRLILPVSAASFRGIMTENLSQARSAPARSPSAPSNSKGKCCSPKFAAKIFT